MVSRKDDIILSFSILGFKDQLVEINLVLSKSLRALLLSLLVYFKTNLNLQNHQWLLLCGSLRCLTELCSDGSIL